MGVSEIISSNFHFEIFVGLVYKIKLRGHKIIV